MAHTYQSANSFRESGTQVCMKHKDGDGGFSKYEGHPIELEFAEKSML